MHFLHPLLISFPRYVVRRSTPEELSMGATLLIISRPSGGIAGTASLQEEKIVEENVQGGWEC